MTDKKTFGSFIKEKRKNKNYSQKDLADLLYVTESAVSTLDSITSILQFIVKRII